MRIGEVAAAAGISTRAVRHYHAIGVLPEPARRGNGYRDYGSHDLLALLRVVRLTALGLSLDEVRDALGDPSGHELVEILSGLSADLEGQETLLRRRRERIAHALLADENLVVSPAVADLVRQIRGVVADPDAVRAEQEALELFEAGLSPGAFEDLTDGYRRLLSNPTTVSEAEVVYRRFAALTEQGPDHPEVLAVAEKLCELGTQALAKLASGGGASADHPAGPDPEAVDASGDVRAWELMLDSLTPAQRHCMLLGRRYWDRP